MSTVVCLYGNTLFYPRGGGHFWVYLNWALGLRAAGCRVVWLEGVPPEAPEPRVRANADAIRKYLEYYGLKNSLALCSTTHEKLSKSVTNNYLDLDAVSTADLLLDLGYAASPRVAKVFRRSALVDIDPGLLQTWIASDNFHPASHDCYFTIGETVGQQGSPIPSLGLRWQYTPPCVALDVWRVSPQSPGSAFTTVSHWGELEWLEHNGELYANSKKNGFMPFIELPLRSPAPLELALCLAPDEEADKSELEKNGWRVRNAHEVAPTPWCYQTYVRNSLGEFSCAKPSCVRFQNAWISDRTICYLASGKPAIVQHTGPSRFLPDAEGLFRFRNIEEAARALEMATSDYDRHCAAARALAEEYFDAQKVATSVLERALA